LAKLAYGRLPPQLRHKIEKKAKNKKSMVHDGDVIC
jgi:hypothetical protein